MPAWVSGVHTWLKLHELGQKGLIKKRGPRALKRTGGGAEIWWYDP